MSASRRCRTLSFFSKLKVENFAFLLSVRRTKNRTNDKRYRDISKNSIFFDNTIRYMDIENDISIFSIYQIITINNPLQTLSIFHVSYVSICFSIICIQINSTSIILAVHRRSCCQHWKIARGRSGKHFTRYTVELMFLVVIGPCHDTVTYLHQAYSVLYQSPSQPYLFLCNTDLKIYCF